MNNNALKILIAPDKFKGSISAPKVAESLAIGIRKNYQNAQIEFQPMADGGDGSIDLLNEFWGLTEHRVEVHDPLFRKITASWFSNKNEAFIEMAKASGLALLNKQERDPMKTTSLGTGELIFHAYQKGFKKINLFIGGSATNDAGIGMATALGYRFFDKKNMSLIPTGENLLKIRFIKKEKLVKRISDLKIRIICDVNNPLFGKKGAAHVYGRQKGADDKMIEQLDAGLKNINSVFENLSVEREEIFSNVQNLPGAGAAGGVGSGMTALFNAELIQGIDLFIDLFDLEKKIKTADFVISGEGQLDSQSLQGKVIGGVLKLCKKHKKPLIVVCGQNKLNSRIIDIQSVKSILELTTSIEFAMSKTSCFLEKIGAELRF